jgi:hypothetical protein
MFDFSEMSRPGPRPTQPSIQWIPEKLSRGKCGLGLWLATYLHLVPRLRIHGAILPHPLYVGRNLLFYLCVDLFKTFLEIVRKYCPVILSQASMMLKYVIVLMLMSNMQTTNVLLLAVHYTRLRGRGQRRINWDAGYVGNKLYTLLQMIPMAAHSKGWDCGRSISGSAGSNPPGGMDVSLLWVLYVFRWRSLWRADHSSRGVLPSLVCLSVIVKPR